MSKKKILFVPFGAAATVLALAALAFACTVWSGTFTVKGNAGSGSVTSTALRTNMVQAVSAGHAAAKASGGAISISTGTAGCCSKLPARSYQVRYLNGPGYSDHTHWLNDCMVGSPAPSGATIATIGTVSVGADGRIAGQPKTFSLPRSKANAAGQESAVCVSSNDGLYGNEAPLAIV
jgi:hypothetical protein